MKVVNCSLFFSTSFFICDNFRNVKWTNLSSSILAKFTAWIRNTAVTFPPFWLLFYARIVYHDACTMYIPYLSPCNDSPWRRNFCILPPRNKLKVFVVRSVMLYRYHAVYKLLIQLSLIITEYCRIHILIWAKIIKPKSIFYFADGRLIGILRKLITLRKYIFFYWFTNTIH